MIPPGIHFLSFCQLGQPGQLAPYAGRFLGFAEGQVVVMRWDPATEALVDLSDEDEVSCLPRLHHIICLTGCMLCAHHAPQLACKSRNILYHALFT